MGLSRLHTFIKNKIFELKSSMTPPDNVLEAFRSVLRPPEAISEPSWSVLEASWKILGSPWSSLEASQKHLEAPAQRNSIEFQEIGAWGFSSKRLGASCKTFSQHLQTSSEVLSPSKNIDFAAYIFQK